MNHEAIARAVDHLADASRFAREVQLEAQRGNLDAAKRFAALAQEAASQGAREIGLVEAG